MKKTKIICTIGPACEKEEVLKELMLSGMNVARFNFSHGTHEEQEAKLRLVQKVRDELGLPIATLMDTKGPEIRLKDFENGEAFLNDGDRFILTVEDVMGTKERASITYKGLIEDVKEGMSILIDDGMVELQIEEITETDIICRVIDGGRVANHKGVNVPGAEVSMPFISDVDMEDLLFGLKMDYDYIAASFTRCRDDIIQIRGILNAHKSRMKIIAKIENLQGINNIDEIIEVSDGIMVARGDMGVEIPLEEVPVLQKEIIRKAVEKGKIVITATQMLESMIKNPRPTRAETTDIANAIFDGTTAIMLSGETAAGNYPVEAVKIMSKIAERTEQSVEHDVKIRKDNKDVTTAISHAADMVAMEIHAQAIVTVTLTGFTAHMVSRFMPECSIISCTTSEKVWRQMNLLYGVVPVLVKEEQDENVLFDNVVKTCKDMGYIHKGDNIVLTAGVPLGAAGNTNMIKVVHIS